MYLCRSLPRPWLPALILAAVAWISASVAMAATQTHTVRIMGTQKRPAFSPERLTIKAGDTVKWVYDATDQAPHTVTHNGQPPVFDSGAANQISQGGSWNHTFTEPGTFDYFCLPHPGMVGTIVVEPASAAATAGVRMTLADGLTSWGWAAGGCLGILVLGGGLTLVRCSRRSH